MYLVQTNIQANHFHAAFLVRRTATLEYRVVLLRTFVAPFFEILVLPCAPQFHTVKYACWRGAVAFPPTTQ